MSTTSAQLQARCYLLELPAELRTIIWELVLIIPTTPTDDRIGLIYQKDADLQRTKVEPDPLARGRLRLLPQFKTTHLGPSVLALLRTCHQIHTEAMPIFYTNNRLSISVSEFQRRRTARTAFFNVLIYSRRSWITRLCVQAHNGGIEEQQVSAVFKLAATLPRLRELSLYASAGILKHKVRLKSLIANLHQVERVRILVWEMGIDWVKDEEIVKEIEEALPKFVAERKGKEKEGE